MSEYPRPEPLPKYEPKPYRPDEVVARLYFAVYGLVFLFALVAAIRGDSRLGPAVAWVNLGTVTVLLWLIFAMGAGRRWAMGALVVLVGLVVVGSLESGSVVPMLLNLPLGIYCLARLLGVLKPRPDPL